jgi:hypothetical protein
MAAFQIRINGKTYCESDDISVITMSAEELPQRGGYRISLHAGSQDTPVQWLTADFAVGDEITIQVVDESAEHGNAPEECSFCGRDMHALSNLVQGASVAICDHCVTEFSNAVKTGDALPLGTSIRSEPEWICGFCSNKPGEPKGVLVRNGAALSPECLRACSDVLA